MLTVIFGAGASYDSIPSLPPSQVETELVKQVRPPLANELFEDRGPFNHAIAHFQRLQPIIPWLRHTEGRNVESVLRSLLDEADSYPERHRQIMAVRYYLQYVLWDCGMGWQNQSSGVTNYKSLLDEIARFRKEKVVSLITFNYDTLLEDALPVVRPPIASMGDYVRDDSPYKVFKLHGSVNWARTVGQYAYKDRNAWFVARDHIERAATLAISDTFVMATEHPCGMDHSPHGTLGLVPAIAIPVEQKSFFECPAAHLRVLEQLLPTTQKLLIIGWRGTEDHFVTLLSKHLKKPIPAYIVAGSNDEALNIASRLRSTLPDLDYLTSPGGFTDAIINHRVRDLLARPSI
jgi:SIR2-like domain